MKKLTYLLFGVLAASLFFSGCLEDDDLEQQKKDEQTKLQAYIQTNSIYEVPKPSGLYVIISDSGKGSTALSTDYVLVNYSMRLINNTLLETNDAALAAKSNMYPLSTIPGPVMLDIKKVYIQGFAEGLTYLKDSAKAKFIVPSKLALGSYYSNYISSYSTILYNVELVQIVKDPIARDRSNINRWVDSLGMQLSDTLNSGVYLKIDSIGTGDLPASGANITVNYKGWLVDDRYFTSKTKDETITFKYDNNKVLAGFDSAVSRLRAGSYARFIIPYYKAYGESGTSNDYNQKVIPIFTSLVYQVHVTKIAK